MRKRHYAAAAKNGPRTLVKHPLYNNEGAFPREKEEVA
jgi:hypothetical protein